MEKESFGKAFNSGLMEGIEEGRRQSGKDIANNSNKIAYNLGFAYAFLPGLLVRAIDALRKPK